MGHRCYTCGSPNECECPDSQHDRLKELPSYADLYTDLKKQIQKTTPGHIPTDAERADFAYGNAKLANDAVTHQNAELAVAQRMIRAGKYDDGMSYADLRKQNAASAAAGEHLSAAPHKAINHHAPIGQILEIRPGVFVVPYEVTENGHYCVVVHSSTNDAYPVGGYNILVFRKDSEAARIVDLSGKLS